LLLLLLLLLILLMLLLLLLVVMVVPGMADAILTCGCCAVPAAVVQKYSFHLFLEN